VVSIWVYLVVYIHISSTGTLRFTRPANQNKTSFALTGTLRFIHPADQNKYPAAVGWVKRSVPVNPAL
jgi:hypothetical protein